MEESFNNWLVLLLYTDEEVESVLIVNFTWRHKHNVIELRGKKQKKKKQKNPQFFSSELNTFWTNSYQMQVFFFPPLFDSEEMNFKLDITEQAWLRNLWNLSKITCRKAISCYKLVYFFRVIKIIRQDPERSCKCKCRTIIWG